MRNSSTALAKKQVCQIIQFPGARLGCPEQNAARAQAMKNPSQRAVIEGLEATAIAKEADAVNWRKGIAAIIKQFNNDRRLSI